MFNKKRGFAILPAIAIIATIIIGGLGVLNYSQNTQKNLSLSGFFPSGGGTYRLGTSISSTDTSIRLSSFKEPVSDTKYTMAILNSDVAYGTIAPQSTLSEFVSFTGITQNADGSATLTGVTRGLSRSYPYTASSTFRMAHAGQSIFILSDAPGLFNEYVTKRNDETISGAKTFTATSTFASTTIVNMTPTTGTMVANKSYVDTSIGSATTTINNEVVHLAGTETITGAKIFSALATFASTTINGTSTINGAMTYGTIASYSSHPTFTSDTQIIDKKYADDILVFGAPIADTTTTGIARKATSAQIAAGYASSTPYFIPSSLASSTASSTSIVVSTLAGTGKIDPSFLSGTENYTFAGTTTISGNIVVTGTSSMATIVRTYAQAASPVTWSKPTRLLYVDVELWGGGGSGGAASGGGAGGGGGAYNKVRIYAASLGATETITIGAGGSSVGITNSGNAGGTTSFGSLVYAYGGGGGRYASTGGGGGGGGSKTVGAIGGDGTGGDGGSPMGGVADGAVSIFGGGGGGAGTTAGGESYYGGGGGGVYQRNGGASYYGGGGGAGSDGGTGGASVYGGAGGNDGANGTVPSGGGGGKAAGASGAGANGQARVTEYFF